MSERRSLVCTAPDCLRMFGDSVSMLQHQVDKHGNKFAAPLPPAQVDKHGEKKIAAQPQRANKAPAMRPVTAKSLACDTCGSKFGDSASMHQHQVDKHGEKKNAAPPPAQAQGANKAPATSSATAKSLACVTCGSKFGDPASMHQHQIDKHGTKKVAAPPPAQAQRAKKAPAVPTASEKSLACCTCGSKFKTHTDLHQHQQASPGHRQISKQHNGSLCSCNECHAIFELPIQLEQHFLAKHPVLELSKDDAERDKVAMTFHNNWRHPGKKPTVLSVFRVHNPGERTKRSMDYAAKLKASNNGVSNEVFRYHGTTVRCGLGVETKSLCSSIPLCNLCSIIKSGFKKKKAEVSGFLRFGVGIYLTETSSKANDYVKAYDDGGAARSVRAMLVCKVCAGNVYKVQSDMRDLLEPPEGFDSVAGVPGVRLNYDELVVYSDAAVLPQYVIVYNV